MLLETDYFDWSKTHLGCAAKTVYTGPVDRFYEYRFGPLAYRSLRFETEELPMENFQGNAVVNYTAREKDVRLASFPQWSAILKPKFEGLKK